MDTKVLVRVNNVDIVSTSDEQLIAIKPICEALGIDRKSQQVKINEHPILSSARVVTTLTASDGKRYEMFCLPIEYIFGWLFTINPLKVGEDAREPLIKYQRECYHALYEYFTGQQRKVIEQNKVEIALLEEISNLSSQQVQIKQSITEKKRKLEKLREERLNDEPTLF